MKRIAFLPGFDGEAGLRRGFLGELSRRNEVRAVSYPNRPLGTLQAYREHAMAQAPVDWHPVLVAESFSGLVATQWASVDPRVQALVLCAAFARNPLGYATHLGVSFPGLVKLGPSFLDPAVQLSASPERRRWSTELARTLGGLRDDVVAERLRIIAGEDVSALLARLRIPVVLVLFEDDMVINAAAREALVRACGDAQVLRLPGPHFALEIHPQECVREIEQALARAAGKMGGPS